MHRAGVRGPFQLGLLLLGQPPRHHDAHGQLRDPSGRLGGHLFLDGDPESGELDLLPFGQDPHDGGDADPQASGDEVGGGEALALALIVHRGVGHELRATRPVHRFTTQSALIRDIDLNHKGPPDVRNAKRQSARVQLFSRHGRKRLLHHELLESLHGLGQPLGRVRQGDAQIALPVLSVHRARDHPDVDGIQDLEAEILRGKSLGDGGPDVEGGFGILNL